MSRTWILLVALLVGAAVAGYGLRARAEDDSHRSLPERYGIDRSHSYVGFTVPFMGLNKVRGSFGRFFGTILLDADHPERSSVRAVIRAMSIDTNDDLRDKHLRSPDFFDVERFPFITFESRRVTRTREGFLVEGTLTMHGVTRQVRLPMVQLHPPSYDVWRNVRVGFKAELSLEREDYGILGTAFWNNEFDPGRMAIGKTVTVELNIEATQPNVARWDIPAADSLAALIEVQGTQRVLGREVGPPADPAVPALDVLVVTSLKLDQRGRKTLATEVLESATKRYPQSSWALTLLAERYLHEGRERGTVETLLVRAVAADSNDTDAREWLRRIRR